MLKKIILMLVAFTAGELMLAWRINAAADSIETIEGRRPTVLTPATKLGPFEVNLEHEDHVNCMGRRCK